MLNRSLKAGIILIVIGHVSIPLRSGWQALRPDPLLLSSRQLQGDIGLLPTTSAHASAHISITNKIHDRNIVEIMSLLACLVRQCFRGYDTKDGLVAAPFALSNEFHRAGDTLSLERFCWEISVGRDWISLVDHTT